MAAFPTSDTHDVNTHFYATEGVPALGDAMATRTRLLWESMMRSWNACLSTGTKPLFPPNEIEVEEQDSNGALVVHSYIIPYPTFKYPDSDKFLPLNPYTHTEYFSLMRVLWKRHELLSRRYLLRMSKHDYKIGQQKAHQDYLDSVATGVVDIQSIKDVLALEIAGLAAKTFKSMPSTFGSIRRDNKRNRIASQPETTSSKQARLQDQQSVTKDHDIRGSGGSVRNTVQGDGTRKGGNEREGDDVVTGAGGNAERDDNLTRGNSDTTSRASVVEVTTSLRAAGGDTEREKGAPRESRADVDERDGASHDKDRTELSSSEEGVHSDDEEEDDKEDEEEIPFYELSFVTGERINSKTGAKEYRIHWKGFGQAYDTWEPEVKIQEVAEDLILQFQKRISTKQSPRGHSYDALESLFASTSDINEMYQSMQAHCDFLKQSQHTPHLQHDTSSMLQASARLQEVSVRLETRDDFTQELALSVIPYLSDAASIVSTGIEDQAKRLVMRQARGRAYLFIFNWFTQYGPHLSASLLQAYREDNLASLYPVFAPTVETIARAVDVVFERLKKERLPFAKLPDPMKQIHLSLDVLKPLLPSATSSITLTLPQISYRSPERLRPLIEQVILDFISTHLVLESAKQVLGNDSRGEWIVRGATVEALVDTFDDDGVLCCDQVERALKSPWTLFGDHRATQTANSILKDPEGTTERLRDWLQTQPLLPDVQEKSHCLGAAAHFIVEHTTKLKISSGRRVRMCRAQKMQMDISGIPVSLGTLLSSLCPFLGHPSLGFISGMLRDVIAFQTGGSTYLGPLQRILQCRDILTSAHSATLNPDHVNPIRASNHHQNLLSENLLSCSSLLTSKHGLTNILVRFGTGQGYRTRDFLKNHLSGKWFTTKEECAEFFDKYRKMNEGSARSMRIADGSCWGQFSWMLDVKPVKGEERDLRERFKPMFSSSTLKVWRTFLGENLFNKDHSTVDTECLRSYGKALELINSLGIEGFGLKSITRMQVVNFMAIVGLCRPASVEDMARLTFQNRKGALKGLLVLGFDVRNAGEKEVLQAFKCVYTFIDHYLSPEHKDILGFDAIFVEHLLCKVIRWYNILTKANVRDCIDRILEAEKDEDWKKEGFPMPLIVNREELAEWLKDFD